MNNTTTRFLSVITLVMCLGATNAQGGVIVDVLPSLGPNFLVGSPASSSYALNAVDELRGIPTGADRDDDPAGYILSPPVIPISAALASVNFNSWNGSAAPTAGWDDGSSTTGAFSAELGSNIFMGLRAYVDDLADGISLSGLAGELHWEDLGVGACTPGVDCTSVPELSNVLAFPAGALTSYTANRVGVTYSSYGADGKWGGIGPDADTVLATYRSGPATQKVDAIFLVGLGDAVFVSNSGGGTDQDALDDVAGALALAPIQQLTASYTIASMNMMDQPTTGSGKVILPEPSSAAMILSIFCCFLASGCRRRGL